MQHRIHSKKTLTINDIKTIFEHMPKELHDKEFNIRVEYRKYKGDFYIDFKFDKVHYDEDSGKVIIEIEGMLEKDILKLLSEKKERNKLH